MLLPSTTTSSVTGSSAKVGPDEPGVPLEHVPTITTKQDITHYLGILTPLVVTLQEDEMDTLVYLDPYKEHTDYQTKLDDASELDGCYSGFACPGWKDAPDYASALDAYVAAATDATAQNKLKAAMLRKSAWENYVNFRYMEARMQERCGDYAAGPGEDFCMPKSQIKVENQLWRDWLSFRERFAAFTKWALDVPALAVKESDFVDVQRFDLELQKFRQRFRSATGLSPSSPWPDSPPDEGFLNTLGTALKMVSGAALVLGGVYIGTRVFSSIGARGNKSLPASEPQHTKHTKSLPEPARKPALDEGDEEAPAMMTPSLAGAVAGAHALSARAPELLATSSAGPSAGPLEDGIGTEDEAETE